MDYDREPEVIYKPETAVEKAILKKLFHTTVIGHKCIMITDGYQAEFERGPVYMGTNDDGESIHLLWDEEGRYHCYIHVYPEPSEEDPMAHLDMDKNEYIPVSLYVVDHEYGIEGMEIAWNMPENEWGHAQSNWWPGPPVLSKPEEK